MISKQSSTTIYRKRPRTICSSTSIVVHVTTKKPPTSLPRQSPEPNLVGKILYRPSTWPTTRPINPQLHHLLFNCCMVTPQNFQLQILKLPHLHLLSLKNNSLHLKECWKPSKKSSSRTEKPPWKKIVEAFHLNQEVMLSEKYFGQQFWLRPGKIIGIKKNKIEVQFGLQ